MPNVGHPHAIFFFMIKTNRQKNERQADFHVFTFQKNGQIKLIY